MLESQRSHVIVPARFPDGGGNFVFQELSARARGKLQRRDGNCPLVFISYKKPIKDFYGISRRRGCARLGLYLFALFSSCFFSMDGRGARCRDCIEFRFPLKGGMVELRADEFVKSGRS